MKKISLIAIMLFFMVSTGFTAVLPGIDTNINTNSNISTNANVNTNTNVNTNVLGQGQNQGQGQKQSQGQLQGQMQGINAPMTNANTQGVSVVTERPLLGGNEINPINLPLINGTIGNYNNVPKFANKNLVPLAWETDVVVKVLGVYSGNFFSKIRMEDVEVKLLEAVDEIAATVGADAKVRYVVQFKDSASASGIGGGAVASVSDAYTNGGSSGTFGVLPGYHTSTKNPVFIIKFYQIQ